MNGEWAAVGGDHNCGRIQCVLNMRTHNPQIVIFGVYTDFMTLIPSAFLSRLLLLFLSFISIDGFSQSACETVALRSQEEVLKLAYYQAKEIRQVLRNWEDSCGKSEPIQRISILMDIREGKLVDSICDHYFETGYASFVERVSQEAFDDYQETYNANKAYFGYSPLRAELDGWTIGLANTNLRYTDNGSKAQAFCQFFGGDLNALDEFYRQYRKANEFDIEPNFTAGLGAWTPLGTLSGTFQQSFNFGMGFSAAITRKYRVGLDFDYTFLSKHADFDVKIKGVTSTTNSDGIMNLSANFIRRFKPNDNFFIDTYTGFGYGRMDTDVIRSEEDSTYYGINTICVPVGVRFLSKVKNGPYVGLNIAYNYCPFTLDKTLLSKMGPHSLTVRATVVFGDYY